MLKKKKITGKLVIVSGPSGSGKTTIARHLLSTIPSLQFSVSATTRPKRANEKDGVDYHFISVKEFKNKIKKDEFVEWEEVYHGAYYGTLKQEITSLWQKKLNVLFDVDVIGALNLKIKYPKNAIAIIVVPPSIESLKSRLKGRKTETDESLERRLGKAEEEMKLAKFFDAILVNDTLEESFVETESLVKKFLKKA